MTTATPDPSSAERACFEAGIKFGSLYHQFAGTPVSPDSARSLERAIEAAIENQPACVAVSVEIDDQALQSAIDAGGADYTELTGRLMDVRIEVYHDGTNVVAEMAMEDGYPLMQLESVEESS